MSKGYIGIHGLKLSCIIGCNKHERIQHQILLIDVKFVYDFTECVKSDHLYSTVDYEAVANFISKTAHSGKFHVIEALATTIACEILKKFAKIKECYIKITKPSAIENAEACFVEYTHTRTNAMKKSKQKPKVKRK